MIDVFDYILKKIISVFYRLTLLIWSLFVLFIHDNSFSIWVYSITILIYTSLTWFCYEDKRYNSKFRLLLDYGLITTISIFKSPLDSSIIFYIVIPILNSSNHTRERNSIQVYFLSFIVLAILLLVSEGEVLGINSITPYCIIFATLIIVELTVFRESFKRTLTDIIDDINTFYRVEYDKSKLYKIYDTIIDKVNSKRLLSIFGLNVDTVICFMLKEQKLILFNSSVFIEEYTLNLGEELNQSIQTELRKDVLGRCSFSYNEKREKEVLVISPEISKSKEYRFVFLIEMQKPIPKLAMSETIFFRYFAPIFSYLSRLYVIHLESKDAQSTFHLENRNKLEYILRAINVMHFVRNRLSPIKTFINLSRLENESEITAIKTRLNADRKKMIRRAEKEFSVIIGRANYLLEQSKNPFIINRLDRLSVRSLFALIREEWFSYFDESDIHIHQESQSESILTLETEYDPDYLIMVVSDLINNISKYHEGDKGVFIKRAEDEIIVNFYNNFNESEFHNLRKVISTYNTEKDWEINKRKTFGLFFIKTMLNQMNVGSRLKIEGEKFFTELHFKVIE